MLICDLGYDVAASHVAGATFGFEIGKQGDGDEERAAGTSTLLRAGSGAVYSAPVPGTNGLGQKRRFLRNEPKLLELEMRMDELVGRVVGTFCFGFFGWVRPPSRSQIGAGPGSRNRGKPHKSVR